MKIENTEVYGFRAALRAMRNPMDSWDKSDTMFMAGCVTANVEGADIGPEDLKLACKLIRGGSEHRKFLRQIIVGVDFDVPRYVWQEIDTYKVATVRNSCSTMHKLGHRELTEDDFEARIVLPVILQELNRAGAAYRDKVMLVRPPFETVTGYDIVRYMKQILPEGFLQRATYTCSYETLFAMHRQRKNHRLPEWSGPGGICEWIRCLPYMKEFIEASEGK